MIHLKVFYQDLKSANDFVIFLAIQGVIFKKNTQNWSKIAYLKLKCGSQKDVDTDVDSIIYRNIELN